MSTYAEWKYWLDTIVNEGTDKLNDWEDTFIESILERMSKGEDLTSKQADQLEKIYNKVTK